MTIVLRDGPADGLTDEFKDGDARKEIYVFQKEIAHRYEREAVSIPQSRRVCYFHRWTGWTAELPEDVRRNYGV